MRHSDPSEPASAASSAAASAQPWHARTAQEVLAGLATGSAGLSEAEAVARLGRYGRNELPEARRSSLVAIYVRQFANPLIYLLLAAAVVSLVIGELGDAGFIFAVLQLNAAVGTVQEWQAEKGAFALRRLIRQTAEVIRGGERRRIGGVELVPGDIVHLESGMRVPADLRLVADVGLTIDESLLTGESTPINKSAQTVVAETATLGDRLNMLFAGSVVLRGRAQAVAVATGEATELGRVAASLAHLTPTSAPLVIEMARLTRAIGVVVVAACVGIGLALILSGMPMAQVFFVAVALAVSAIPEGLPVAVTVVLAIATRRMAARRVIVRHLPAVEGLGACTVIASDKTGTLTCNALTVRRVYLPRVGLFDVEGEGYAPVGAVSRGGVAPTAEEAAALAQLARTGAIANEAHLAPASAAIGHAGDTVDLALLALAGKLGIDTAQPRTVEASIPFEAERRFSAAFQSTRDGIVVHVKGATEVVLPMCADADIAATEAAMSAMAKGGYRVLALAAGNVPEVGRGSLTGLRLTGLRFLGLVGLIDPLRPEAAPAVARCRAAGIGVIMVTGDHPVTASAIARSLGIAESSAQVATGSDLARVERDSAALRSLVADHTVFARVEPMQKLRIVEELQSAGHVVAVTGDGVNDAPALRRADIGVAMGQGGTDVARDAADLIVADDNFASIVNGVEEGRIAHDNLRKILLMLFSTGAAEIMLFAAALAMGLPLPLYAVQLLWLNLVTNGVQDVALAFERGEPDVLARPPRRPGFGFIDRAMIRATIAYGAAMGVVAIALFAVLLRLGYDEAAARNILLLVMVAFENVLVFACRSEQRSIFNTPIAANPYVLLAVLGTQAIHVSAMHLPYISDVLRIAPIRMEEWFLVAAITALLVAATELYKWRARAAGRMNPTRLAAV